ncbi:MAG: M48 family metalloprotease [Thermoanaerobaculia bacterium]
MKRATILLALLFVAADASAQWQDLLRKGAAIKEKVDKGARVAKALTREFTEEEEVALGRIVAARILATYPLADDPDLQKYVGLVGRTLVPYSTRPALDWHFAVLDTPVVNAFSAPGGYVFVTTGALDHMESEAELAAVLGHEIAHATEKHILREIKRANVVTEGLNLAQSELGRGDLTDELARKISDLAYEKLFNTGIGRQEELDADRIGAALAADAGYASSAYEHFLRELDALARGNESVFAQLASTHPRPEDRLDAIQAALDPNGVTVAERWAAMGH